MAGAFLPDEPRKLSRFGDLVGLAAFYPLFSIGGYLSGSLALLLASRVYFILLLLAMTYVVWGLGWPRVRKARAAAVLFALSAAALLLELSPLYESLGEILGAVGDVLPMVVVGLLAHDVAGASPGGSKLDRFGGITVLGSFLIVIREPITILLGLVLMTLGLGGISQGLKILAARAQRGSPSR